MAVPTKSDALLPSAWSVHLPLRLFLVTWPTPWQVRAKACGNIPWKRDQICVWGIRRMLLVRDSSAVLSFAAAGYCYGDQCNHCVSAASSTQTPGEFCGWDEGCDSLQRFQCCCCSADLAPGLICRCMFVSFYFFFFFSLRVALFWWVIRHFRLWKRSNIQNWGGYCLFLEMSSCPMF